MRRKDPKERKTRISIAIKEKTIKLLEDNAKKEGRSRSDIIQRLLDAYFIRETPRTGQ